MSVRTSVARSAATAGGQVLRGATAVMTARPAGKPLHPRGDVVEGRLRRFGHDDKTGAAWLDQAGVDDALVRESRAVGLPPRLPDVFGLAIRVPTEGGRHGDVLFASTGLGRLTRFTLTAGRSPHHRPMTTLLPYRTPAGAVILSAVFRGEVDLELAWAVRAGVWHPFAELVLDQGSGVETSERSVSFEPVRNVPSGLETYDWVRRLREPAYSTARRSRRTSGSQGAEERRAVAATVTSR